MTKAFIALSICLMVGGLSVVAAVAAEEAATFSIDWADQPLSAVLTTLNKHFGVNYVLPAELGNTKVSANLLNVTPERALRTVVSKAGLLAQLRNGTWMISSPNPTVATPAAYAQMPGMGGMGGMGGRGMAGADPTSPMGLGMPGAGGSLGVGRGRTGRFGAMTGTTGSLQNEMGPRNYQVVPVRRIDPALVAEIFGGGVIYGDSSGGGGGGYGSSGSSGYGRSSSGYGSSSSSSRSGGRSSSSSRSSSRGSSYY